MRVLYSHHTDFEGDWPWKNFTRPEVSCRHCGEFHYDLKAMTALQLLRDGWGAPIVITSAHRCADHNRAVGGTVRSNHLKIAFDCACPREKQELFAKTAKIAGFTGIIRYPSRGFVHLDLRETPYEDVLP